MKTISNPKKESEYLNKMDAFNEEFGDFIKLERNAIKNLTKEELSQMREKMQEEIDELYVAKKRKNVEIFMVIFLLIICLINFHFPVFYIAAIFEIIVLFSLNKTIRKITLLNYSILMFEEEFDIYYDNK